MAFRPTLVFYTKEYNVIDYNYSLKRDVNSKERSSSNIYGDRIHSTVIYSSVN